MLEDLFKCFFRHHFPFPALQVKYFGYGSKRLFFIRLAEPVPRTYVLASITTESPVIKLIFHFAGDQHFFQLYGEIGNAFTAIHYFARENGFSWAGVQAAGAGAAMIFCKRIIIFQLQVSDQRGNKKKEPLFGVSKFPFFPTHPNPLR